ncbi:MAG: glucosamine--fructose-6-phosphate aminotransferase [Alcanivorax borkumensis]|uniref:Glutamine--fructose-6-phosphate aminotransferase [isomerizing] n=1 Tax=Alcanivorax borkumensis (strain ATCC 700651 / DSM 11573 / NCIMB 13689 / SK2) TaxID=393595 RepID=Q0VKX7_ALCBS|nr:glutamine--fructose-6-phosphate transaminase (isomerizing) [Alcanivorax borkumensis]OJH09095.1 MAG: glucosamine--fructose-6-phosphate aminotransferase [Alcanivorax borkumensis]CAL18171.1 glucosamine 6-phosphate synthase [Alcanivorax borkumensis SK2]
MCGIVGAIGQRNVTNILITGLKRLEYRGYDSAGVALLNDKGISRVRRQGKVAGLEEAVLEAQTQGFTGIAHTRWATHGKPSEPNSHPHMSGDDLALVHNGIIENFQALKDELEASGYTFNSQTDTEVIVHLVHQALDNGLNLFDAVQAVTKKLDGAYALGVIHASEPHKLVTVRSGSPLVIGLGIDENYIASDQLALLPVTNRFIFLEEGDQAEITTNSVRIVDAAGEPVTREAHEFDGTHEDAEKGEYRHYMQKEIFEQPAAIQKTLEDRIDSPATLIESFGEKAPAIFDKVKTVQIVACGTSYHAGMVARYWLEDIAGIPCQVEVASEFRYRKHVVPEGTLFVTISQSGETADTLAALRDTQSPNYVGRLAVCNVDSSSLVRESELVFLTKAGPEIGVASTKAFTTQLVGLLMLVLALGRQKGLADSEIEKILEELRQLPNLIEQAAALDKPIEKLSEAFVEKHHALFLGRGVQFPVALEGALKLKEISYIHAEAYAAGELKHGPLALVDSEMPVVSVAPNDELLEKLKSNLQEVRARGGELYVFADKNAHVKEGEGIHVLNMPSVPDTVAPIVYTIPLQLLSYHVAVLRGTDVDQPRNLAKSVTVE